MNAVKTGKVIPLKAQRPTFTQNREDKTKKLEQTIAGLRKQVADLQATPSPLQTLAEIKFVKAKLKTTKEDADRLFAQVTRLSLAMTTLGVGDIAVSKIRQGEPLTEGDLTGLDKKTFLALLPTE